MYTNGHLGAISRSAVTSVSSKADIVKTIKGDAGLLNSIVNALDATFMTNHAGTSGTGNFTLKKNVSVRPKAGQYWAASTSLGKNTNVAVTQRVGNYAKISQGWIESDALASPVTDAAILGRLTANIASGVSHAIAELKKSPNNYIDADGFSQLSVDSLVNIAADHAISQTAAEMGY